MLRSGLQRRLLLLLLESVVLRGASRDPLLLGLVGTSKRWDHQRAPTGLTSCLSSGLSSMRVGLRCSMPQEPPPQHGGPATKAQQALPRAGRADHAVCRLSRWVLNGGRGAGCMKAPPCCACAAALWRKMDSAAHGCSSLTVCLYLCFG